MSRISDMEEQISNMYEQIKLMEDTLIKTKLQEGVKALKEKGELSDEESSDYIITEDAILLRILDEQGIGENGYCWISTDRHNHEYGYYIMKIDGDYISISPEGRLCKQSIESIKELLDEIFEYNWNICGDVSEYINTITNLTDIDLEHLKPKIQEKMPDELEVTFEDEDYEYDDDYEHYETEEDLEARFDMYTVDDEPEYDDYDLSEYDSIKDISYILFDAGNRGELDEKDVTKLNSMSIEILKKYFEFFPDDIAIFEKMRIKYPNIQSLAEREAEEHSGGDEFVTSIVDYATKKVEVRDQNAQAEQLAQDYEQQLPANEQSLDDE